MKEKDKIFNKKGKEIFSIFFTYDDWYSLKEASKIYDPNLSEESRNQSTIAHYFYRFKKLFLVSLSPLKQIFIDSCKKVDNANKRKRNNPRQ